MNLRYDTGTDVAVIAFFDPTVLNGQESPKSEAQTRKLAASGDAILYMPCADGSYRIAVFIDEEPPAYLCKKPEHTREGMILRVPNGRLVATGMEDLSKLDSPLDLKVFKHEMGDKHRIPPGIYRVRAWDYDPEDIIPANELEPDLSDFPRITRVAHQWTGYLAGIGCLSLFICAVYFVILIGTEALFSWWALPLIFPLLIFPAIIYLPPLLVPQWGQLLKRVAIHHSALAEKYPPVVIVMEKIDEMPDRFPSGSFGEGAMTP